MIQPLWGGLAPLGVARGGAAADWWPVPGQTCMAAYKPIGAADLATSYINLANPGTYNAAPGVAPTLGEGGWGFNGSTQYLTTGVTPTNNQQWSMIARLAQTSAAAAVVAGSFNIVSSRRFGIWPRYTDNFAYYDNGNEIGKADGSLSGVLAIAGNKAYRNGVDEGVTIPAGDGGAMLDIYIGAQNRTGSALNYFAGTIAAVAIYSSTLSAADVASLTARMAALT